jgi:hypothetical protein
MVDQDGVGRLDCGLAQEPSAGVLQDVGSERVDALAHGGQAEVGAVGDQGGQQRAVRVGTAGLVAAEWLEGAGEAAQLVDVLQQVLDADAPQAGADRGTQFAERVRDGHGVALLELEPAIVDGGEAVGGQAALDSARGAVELGAEPGQERLPVDRQVEAPICLFAGLLPVLVVVDEVPERDVVAAMRQEQAARAKRVADRKRERDLPDGAVELAVADEIGPPIRLDEAVRVIGCERAARAGIECTDRLDDLQQDLAAGGGLERQGEEGRQVLAQDAVARERWLTILRGARRSSSRKRPCARSMQSWTAKRRR